MRRLWKCTRASEEDLQGTTPRWRDKAAALVGVPVVKGAATERLTMIAYALRKSSALPHCPGKCPSP